MRVRPNAAEEMAAMNDGIKKFFTENNIDRQVKL